TAVLGPTERDLVRAKIMAFNAEISTAIADTEQRRGVQIAPVDTLPFFDQLTQQGAARTGGRGPDVTTGCPGGIFSLPPSPPRSPRPALRPNWFMAEANRGLGASSPPVDVARVARRDRLVNNTYRPAGEVPFGVIASEDIDPGAFFDGIANRVSRGAKNFA